MKEKLAAHLYSPIMPHPDAEDGEQIRAFVFGSPDDEAQFIADDILKRAHPCPNCDGTGKVLDTQCPTCEGLGTWGRNAACYRMRAIGSYLERALMQNGIPFVNLNGASFWKIKHIQIAWQYIAMVLGNNKQQVDGYRYVYRIASDRMIQPTDFKSHDTGAYLKRKGDSINHRWIGKEFLRKYSTLESVIHKAKYDSSLSGWKKAGVQDLLYTHGEIFDRSLPATLSTPAGSFKKALDWIIKHVVMPWYVKENGIMDDEEGSFADDMTVLREIASGYNSPAEFLQFIADVLEAAQDKGNRNAVILGTFHKVKGQEFDNVYVAGMAEKICPTVYALGLIPPPAAGYIPPPPSNSGIIDERFCFYVGITRAKKVCTVTCSTLWRGKRVDPSRFISEAGLVLKAR